MRKRRKLVVEALECRRVLSGLGEGGGPPDLGWEQVIVTVQDQAGPPQDVAADIIGRFGGQVGHVYEHALNGFSAYLPAAAVTALANNPRVKAVETDLQMQALTQVVPTGVRRIGTEANTTASIGNGTQIDVDIAILDTGIQSDHPDLNVAGGTRFYSVKTGRKLVSYEDTNYTDENGHGTHVAGIAAARDNEFGVVGVAPGARLWAVRVLDASGNGWVSDIIKGIDWVTANAATIEVVNMSLGGLGANAAYRTAIQNSVAKGIVYVAASGNEYRDILGGDFAFGTSDDTIPAVYPEVATISAIADSDGAPGGLGLATHYGGYADDTYADFSNFSNSDGGNNSWYLLPGNNPVVSPGLGIDLMMPGVDIYSTYLGGGYATMSGTSMAAPHAAGLAALHIAQTERAQSAADVYAIRQALIDGGQPWRSLDGLGLIDGANPDSPDKYEENLGWAAADDTPIALPTVQIVSPTNGATVSGQVLVTATATADRRLAVQQVEFTVQDSLGNPIISSGDTNGSDGWSVSWDTQALAAGPYSIRAVVTDTQAQTAEDMISVTVDNSIRSMSADLSGALLWVNKTTWQAQVTVTVTNDSGERLAGATVTGTWSNGKVSGGTTDANGQITFLSDRFRGTGEVTWTLTGVSLGGYEYGDGQQSITIRSNGTITSSSAAELYQAAALWDVLEQDAVRKGKAKSTAGLLDGRAVDQLLALV